MAGKKDTENSMGRLIVFSLCGIAVIAGVWTIFSYQQEKHEDPSPAASTAASGSVYSSQPFGFQVVVPPGFSVDESYLNQDLGPGREIPGVAFRIPASMSAGTNLSADSHIAVEELSDVDCAPEAFLSSPTDVSEVELGGTRYTKARSGGAGAGNLYEETVYVTEKGSRCYAVRSFIHSTQLGNYPEGTVRAFDRAPLDAALDSVAASLTIY